MHLELAKTLRNYDRKNLSKDILTGLIIMAVSIPISMGYAQIAGLHWWKWESRVVRNRPWRVRPVLTFLWQFGVQIRTSESADVPGSTSW